MIASFTAPRNVKKGFFKGEIPFFTAGAVDFSALL